ASTAASAAASAAATSAATTARRLAGVVAKAIELAKVAGALGGVLLEVPLRPAKAVLLVLRLLLCADRPQVQLSPAAGHGVSERETSDSRHGRTHRQLHLLVHRRAAAAAAQLLARRAARVVLQYVNVEL